MDKLDKKIALVAFGAINKLDVRGGQLGVRENLILTLKNLPEHSIIRDFILKNIDNKYELLAKESNGKLIIKDLSFAQAGDNLQSWLKVKASQFSSCTGGTYRFLQTTNGETYIGSTGNLNERVTTHKKNFASKSKNHLPLHRGQRNKQETLLFSIIHKIPNLLQLFHLEHPAYKLLQGEGELLYLLTHYPIRVLEQNLIDRFRPSINGGTNDNVVVTHSYTKFDPDAFSKQFKVFVAGKPINIYNSELKLLFKAPSLLAAGRYMGLPYKSRLTVYIGNLRGIIINKFGHKIKYLINFEGGKWHNRSLVKPKKASSLTLLNRNLASLNKAFIYLFSYPELNKFLVFRSLANAYEFLYPIKAKIKLKGTRKLANAAFKTAISDKANTGIVVQSESGNSYVIAKNPEWKGGNSILVWAVNLETRYVKLFGSIQEALANLKIKLGTIKTDAGIYCIDTGRLFKLGVDKGFIVFISNKVLSSIVPSLKDNTKDIDSFILSTEELKLVKEIKKIGNRRLIYLYDTLNGVFLNNGKPFDSATAAAKALGVSGHFILEVVDSNKYIKARYLARTDNSALDLANIEIQPRYKKVYAYNSNWVMVNNGVPFNTITEASKLLGVAHSTISSSIKSGKLCQGKYYFRHTPLSEITP